jgi:hypothetical protein
MLFFKHLEQLRLKKHPIIQNLHNVSRNYFYY